jgi:predicted transcriptional regulator
MGDLSDFQRGQIVGERLAGASVTKMATLLGLSRAAVSNVMTAYTNHGRHYRLRGTVAENQD